MLLPREAYYVRIIDGHLFLTRQSNNYLVWLGLKAHVEALDDDSLRLLIAYRLAFDAQCCKSVS
jgi:hypothetical protein